MKKLVSMLAVLLLMVSCASTRMDSDVEYDVKSAPVVDDASVLIAIPVIIGISELPKEEKKKMLQEYQLKIQDLAKRKAEQRQVVFTIIDKLTVEGYEKAKMKQLLKRHSQIERKISKYKLKYLESFVKSMHGKVTEESAKKSIEKLQKHFQAMQQDQASGSTVF